VLDDCLLLIPDSREERRLGAMEKQLEAQQQELEQAQL
jgi:toxic protein SymE